nr:MAG TPA: hypothetical protein [Caudoviricetes sp.]
MALIYLGSLVPDCLISFCAYLYLPNIAISGLF